MLGHQIIATALGAKLKSGDAPEIGFAPIKRIDKHDYFSMWNKTVDVLHWHNDVVSLPEGAQPLARSEKTKVQAFRFGSALGMQFHLEVTPTLLEEWLDESSMVKDLKAAGGSKSQLREAFAEYNPQLQPLADQVFSSFAARCNSYGQNLAQAQQADRRVACGSDCCVALVAIRKLRHCLQVWEMFPLHW